MSIKQQVVEAVNQRKSFTVTCSEIVWKFIYNKDENNYKLTHIAPFDYGTKTIDDVIERVNETIDKDFTEWEIINEPSLQ